MNTRILSRICCSLLLLCLLSTAAQAADQWQNAPQKDRSFESTLLLPDGQRRPVLVWPDGTVRFPDGSVPQERGKLVLPEGQIVEVSPGGQIDTTLFPLPEAGMTPQPLEPEPEKTPLREELAEIPQPPQTTPEEKQEKTPESRPEALVLQPVQPSAKEEQKPRPEVQPAEKTPLTLAGLLPTTPVPPAGKKEEPGAEKETQLKPEKTEAPIREEKPRREKAQEEKPRPPKPEQEKPRSEKPRKTRPGDPLQIPESAKKSGRVDFLEGCWQGLRPEYYSKRTVRECFCFGKNGSGKRYVIDKQGGRRCVGSTSAQMRGEALYVTSSGAFCDDGEKWGAANMTCRGEGQRTPCTWIFTDAEGGRQSYKIPFTRVDSCRR